MVTTTTVSGFNEKGETIYSTNSQEQTAKLNAKAPARTAKVIQGGKTWEIKIM